MAHISWLLQTDAAFAKLLAGLKEDDPEFSFPVLRTLKFRQTSLTDTSIHAVVTMCPALRSINLAFTGVRRPPYLNDPDIPPLEKLSLTSTAVSMDDLLLVISHLPHLRSLSIDALSAGSPGNSSKGNITAMTLDDEGLGELTDILEDFEHLESISLVGNTKLGITTRREVALWEFISRVGRKLKESHRSILLEARHLLFF